MSRNYMNVAPTSASLFANVNWYLITLVFILIIIAICTVFFISRKLDKKDDDENKARKEKQRKYIKHVLSEFLDEIYSFTEEYIKKVDAFDKIKSDYTLADVKQEAKQKVYDLRRSNRFKEMVAMVDTNDLEDLLLLLENTSATLWKEKCSLEIERVLIEYGKQEENI